MRNFILNEFLPVYYLLSGGACIDHKQKFQCGVEGSHSTFFLAICDSIISSDIENVNASGLQRQTSIYPFMGTFKVFHASLTEDSNSPAAAATRHDEGRAVSCFAGLLGLLGEGVRLDVSETGSLSESEIVRRIGPKGFEGN